MTSAAGARASWPEALGDLGIASRFLRVIQAEPTALAGQSPASLSVTRTPVVCVPTVNQYERKKSRMKEKKSEPCCMYRKSRWDLHQVQRGTSRKWGYCSHPYYQRGTLRYRLGGR